ncbi:serine protease [Kitasatospora sp. MAP5-34]|uniref:S1 family serine peptidase n=1 Tax=Kitasatospora sp. MAP5-34 TaxID=3035102 RepID=UPI002475050B|nr:serine protease [Kitasatospora sp. MAP5-34]
MSHVTSGVADQRATFPGGSVLLRKLIVSAGAVLALAFASASPAAAIVGGGDAAPGSAPYQVSIVAQGLFGWSHVCGGFLRDANTVVTAAHCVNGNGASSLQVKYDGVDRTRLAQTRSVSGVLKHPGFNALTMANDVALLKLATAVTENGSTVAFAPLATTAPTAGDAATVTGWGRTQQDDTTLPTSLRTIQVPVTTTTDCEAAYSGLNLNLGGDEGGLLDGLDPVLDTTSMLCAGPADGGQGFCTGDSGDPAVVNGVVVGIVSWSRGCAAAGSPGVYSSVAYFHDWLSQ